MWQQKTEDYVAYRKIESKFDEIGNEQIKILVEKLNEFLKNYPQSKYAYILIKNFLLWIRVGIKDEKINSEHLVRNREELDKFSNFLSKNPCYGHDSKEEKDTLEKTYKEILVKIIMESSFSRDTLLDSKLVSQIGGLSLVSPSLENLAMPEINLRV
jgi:hypothetical protein